MYVAGVSAPDSMKAVFSIVIFNDVCVCLDNHCENVMTKRALIVACMRRALFNWFDGFVGGGTCVVRYI